MGVGCEINGWAVGAAGWAGGAAGWAGGAEHFGGGAFAFAGGSAGFAGGHLRLCKILCAGPLQVFCFCQCNMLESSLTGGSRGLEARQ